MAQQITIDIVAETQKLRKGVDDVNSKLSGIQNTADKLNQVTGAVVGIGVAARGLSAVGGFIGGATSAASEMEQQFGGLDAVFESNGDRLRQFSLEASSLGIAASDAARSAVLIGSQFKATGFDIDTVSDQTEGLLNLSADLAAQFGGTSTDAIEALGSAFRGEFNPIERYGVSLRKSDINARLAAKGLDQLTGDALKQAEIMATLELITERTADAQGAAAREADTYASQQQQMNAELENAKAELGQAFLPLMVELTKVLRIVVDAFTSLPKGVQQGILVFGLVVAVVGPLILLVSSLATAISVIGPIFGGLKLGIAAATGAFKAFSLALLGNPIFLVVAAIVTLIAIITRWILTTDEGKKFWEDAMKAIERAAKAVKEFLFAVFKAIGSFVKDTINNLKNFIEGAWNAILAVTKFIFDAIKAYLTFVFNIYKTIFTTVINTIRNIVETGWNFIKNITSTIFNTVSNIFKNIWGNISGFVSKTVDNIVNFFKQIPDKLLSVGKDIVSGLWKGISDRFNWFKDKILGFFGSIMPGWIKDVLGIRSPSKLFQDIGIDVTEGFVKGLGFEQLREISEQFGRSIIPGITTPETLRTARRQEAVNVTINAGLGTNPYQLGKEVDKALKNYSLVSRV